MPKIRKIYDNIIILKGKYKYKQNMLFTLSKEALGYLISASEDTASLLVIGDPSTIVKNNSNIKESKKSISKVPLYENYFGSIINPFGEMILSSHRSKGKEIGEGTLDNSPPELLDREKLSKPLKTGMLSIDTMIPIGKGQRELIVGDRSTGKTTIGVNAIIHQSKRNLRSIYVAVGQKRSSVIQTYETLKKYNAHKNTIILFASPDSSSEQFFSPKIGMAMAEALAYKGEDILIVIDDLTKHANIYREISLSIDKNPGREAYPTDIFYEHARLLERAGRFNKKYKNGSITCLPIVETIQGDVASVIPSSTISITDGQIFTSDQLANNGKFPAINIALSVSRTGSAVQSKNVKEMSKNLKAEYLELSEINKFTDMTVDVSKTLQKKIDKWKGINNLLIQYGNIGYNDSETEILIEMYKIGLLNKLADFKRFATTFINYCNMNIGAKKIIDKIETKKYKDKHELQNDIIIVFSPLAKIASNIENDIISKYEYENLLMKGGK